MLICTFEQLISFATCCEIMKYLRKQNVICCQLRNKSTSSVCDCRNTTIKSRNQFATKTFSVISVFKQYHSYRDYGILNNNYNETLHGSLSFCKFTTNCSLLFYIYGVNARHREVETTTNNMLNNPEQYTSWPIMS